MMMTKLYITMQTEAFALAICVLANSAPQITNMDGRFASRFQILQILKYLQCQKYFSNNYLRSQRLFKPKTEVHV